MKYVYAVSSDYVIVKIFEKLEDAERCCAIHNDNMQSFDDPYEIEVRELIEDGEKTGPEIYKAIDFSLYEYKKPCPPALKLVNWSMQYSTKPYSKSFKRVYGDIDDDLNTYNGTIPVTKTYDNYGDVRDDKKVEKIVFDAFAKWKAEKEGL